MLARSRMSPSFVSRLRRALAAGELRERFERFKPRGFAFGFRRPLGLGMQRLTDLASCLEAHDATAACFFVPILHVAQFGFQVTDLCRQRFDLPRVSLVLTQRR